MTDQGLGAVLAWRDDRPDNIPRPISRNSAKPTASPGDREPRLRSIESATTASPCKARRGCLVERDQDVFVAPANRLYPLARTEWRKRDRARRALMLANRPNGAAPEAFVETQSLLRRVDKHRASGGLLEVGTYQAVHVRTLPIPLGDITRPTVPKALPYGHQSDPDWMVAFEDAEPRTDARVASPRCVAGSRPPSTLGARLPNRRHLLADTQELAQLRLRPQARLPATAVVPWFVWSMSLS
jgi:hypothetical protein